jgi:hypothetical protein
MTKVNIIFGPKTKLGREIALNLLGKKEEVLLVAREDDDVTIKKNSRHVITTPEQVAKKFNRANIFICAFSKIHPEIPNYPKDINDLLSDGDRLFGYLDHLKPNMDLSIVYISSVLEVGARRENSYYQGLKNISNSIIASYCDKNNIKYTSLLPGRLVDGSRSIFYLNFLHTTYAVLAKKCIELINKKPANKFKVIGLDARIYLVILSVSIIFK